MDYYEIGQRIRKIRKAKGLSQEELAEKVSISVTHMSHIETGNTKLSLPVLVAIADALHTHTDDLIYENIAVPETQAFRDIAKIMETCDPQQAKCITAIIQAAKIAIDQYLCNESSQK